jgi:cytosine-specific methyltransferase|nr:MAG TPA: Cytosine specific methyltransferase [Caudoviricetes sp.]
MAKLGSLFDGAGTMPYAAKLSGIEPVWSSEIESFPLKVTAKRFPHVKQLGDVTKIDGRKIEPVDVITFGSPCQDLSIAGKRAGLDGERSGLFMEAIRIIKEMRDETSTGTDEPVRPRFAVWENVPGAFSSNKGEDFRVVLEEMCKIKDGNAAIPRPKNWKWNTAGLIVGNGYSVAWRVLDARFWGVPQRRRRIWLVADFGGERAGEILFKRAGLRRSFASGRASREEVARDLGNGAQAADGKIYEANGFNHLNGSKAGSIAYTENGSPTLRAGSPTSCVVFFGQDAYDKYTETQQSATIKASGGIYGGGSECLVCAGFSPQAGKTAGISYSVNESPTLQTSKEMGMVIGRESQYIVRRLTPLECCRLQGMPDWWCADVPHSDAPEYKMWGNGMALPCAMYVMEGIAEIYEEEKNANRIV